VEVLTHIPHERQAAAVLELCRVLRPGGVLVISVHNAVRHRAHRIKRRFGSVRPRASGAAIYPLSAVRLRRMLTTAGFQIRSRVRHINFFNRFNFDLARRRPHLTGALAWCEDVMTVVPVLRRLSITMLIEGVKPEETGRTAHGNDRRFP
jgi:SAM-dependent methyltransferase